MWYTRNMSERKATSIRLTPIADTLLKALSGLMGVSRSAVIELGIRELAIKYKLMGQGEKLNGKLNGEDKEQANGR